MPAAYENGIVVAPPMPRPVQYASDVESTCQAHVIWMSFFELSERIPRDWRMPTLQLNTPLPTIISPATLTDKWEENVRRRITHICDLPGSVAVWRCVRFDT